MKGRTRTLRLLLVGLAALGLGGLFASSAAAIDPGDFAELSTGIGRVVVRDCQNHLLSQGTGFLVGTRVLMTAHHVLDVPHACEVRIQIGARTYTVDRWTAWHGGGKKTEQAVDVETIHITTAASGHVYEFAHSVPNLDATVAMIGFPAGNPISLTQGRYLGTRLSGGIPTLAIFLQSAHGASGSPLLNSAGKVIGVLQRGVADLNGGVVVGISLVRESDLPKALCKAYPKGDIAGCAPVRRAPKPPPAPLCLDKQFLRDVGPAWKAATDAFTAFDAGSAPLEVLSGAFDQLGSAAAAALAYEKTGLCSKGLQQAEILIDTTAPLTNEARSKVDAFLAQTSATAAYAAALQAAADALDLLGARVQAVNAAFAAR